jgi:hypothetical protein
MATMVAITSIWKIQGDRKVVLEILRTTGREQERELEAKYPYPEYSVSTLYTSTPETYPFKVGDEYNAGYDSFDFES